MSLRAPFIERPVATTLFLLAMVLAGAVAFGLLPVSPLPQVDYPTISVRASLPGASPETMAGTVATPLERSLARIAGITEMTSTSRLGTTRITLQFDLDRDINGAARDVQAAINAARSLLPADLPNNPMYRKVNPAEAPIMILALTSDTMSRGQMYDAASTILAQKISQVKGIGEVEVGGSALPAVRVELNPAVLHQYGIGFEAVRSAIVGTNVNRPKGAVEREDRHWQVLANDLAQQASDYLPLIVAYRNGAAVRLADVAEVVDSVQDLRNAGSANGRPAVLMVLTREPGANVIEAIERVKALLPQMRASIPGAMDIEVAMDRSASIRASLHEVERSLLISVALVIMVVFIFLRNVRAALIPSVVVPVSIITTFGAMYLLGFSLNNLSLMALAIATGFVVDDAVVMLECISRHVEAGVHPMKAALRGAQEVGFTVAAMTLSLIAVFIPILLMGGIVGRLFREFAITLSVAVLVSLLVSLTVTPMMCSQLLRSDAGQWRLHRASEHIFNTMLCWYEESLSWALAHRRLMLALLLATVGLNAYLYVIVPKGLFPSEDTGRLIGRIRADQSISFQGMRQKLDDFVGIVRLDPAVESVTAVTGGVQRNRGSLYISLKPLHERRVSSEQVISRLRAKLAHEPGARLALRSAQDLVVGARESEAQYQYTLQAGDLAELRTWGPRVRQALGDLPELIDVSGDQDDKGLQTSLVVDRDAAARLGITAGMIDATLNNAFGQHQVSVIHHPLNQYRVVMEAAPEHWQSPDVLNGMHISSPSGAQVPLSAFARYEMTNTPLVVNRHGQFAASTISFNLPAGVSLAEAMEAINSELLGLRVPSTIHGSFQGTARVLEATLTTQLWLILAALVAVYIVLGILYESFVHPVTILSTLPSAGVGALLALLACRTDFTLIALIGVILLIGIVKKNAIMMIDVALDAQRSQGKSAEAAIYHACVLRFRPIMMTTAAALLSAVPLAVGMGENGELRRPLGIAIMGGLLVSQILTLYTTPVVYLYLDRFRQYCAHLRTKPVAEPSAQTLGGTAA